MSAVCAAGGKPRRAQWKEALTKQGRGDPGPRLVELECSPDSVERVMGQVARQAAVQ